MKASIMLSSHIIEAQPRMSTKPEPRVKSDLLVRVFGMDSGGHPFFQNAQAQNISNHGAKLSGIEHPLTAGDTIGVQLGDKKARFKVIWVVDAGHLQKLQVGIQILDGQKCPWQGQVTEGANAAAKSPSSGPGPTLGPPNKRLYPRQRVPFPLEIWNERSGGAQMRTKTTDISGRGCYVETMLPLPVGTALSIAFWLDKERITTAAVVRTCDGGVGMGIEFTGLKLETQEALQRQVEDMKQEASSTGKSAQSAF
jgi:PilZ domain